MDGVGKTLPVCRPPGGPRKAFSLRSLHEPTQIGCRIVPQGEKCRLWFILAEKQVCDIYFETPLVGYKITVNACIFFTLDLTTAATARVPLSGQDAGISKS